MSREILQQNRFIDTIKTGSVKKILGLLENMAKDEPDKYAEFWAQFGQVLKEGPAEDYANRERIARLRPGQRLPSDADLCEEFGVSRMTARHAMSQLADEGLVRRDPGFCTLRPGCV